MKLIKGRAAATLGLMLLFAAALALLILFYDQLVPQPEMTAVQGSAELQQAAQGLDEIDISCRLDADAMMLYGTQTLTMTNRTGVIQSDAVLRSWSGAFLKEETSPAACGENADLCLINGFQPGGLQVISAAVNGQETAWRWQDEACTVLYVPVNEGWQPDAAVQVDLVWEASIPAQKARFGYANGVFMLGNVFPVPALWQNGAWCEDPYTAVGDPFVSECFNWQVSLTAPASYHAAATGYSAPSVSGGMKTWHMTAAAARDFAVVLSRKWQQTAKWQDDVLIVSYAAERQHAAQMTKKAAHALKVYSALWGAYPWPVLTLCETALPWAGMEYPCLLMISDQITGKTSLENTVAHETAHQWWYAMVGSDSVREPWQDESLCEYALTLYTLNRHSEKKRAALIADRAASENAIFAPITAYATMAEYHDAAYCLGLKCWLQLQEQLGRQTLNEALRDYAVSCRFQIAEPETLAACIAARAETDVFGIMKLFSID